MDNKRTFKNYTPEEVDKFLDQVISTVEKMIEDNKLKNQEIALRDKKIEELTNIVNSTSTIREKLSHYEKMEGTLNRAIVMAQKTSDQIKLNAHRESEIILNDAKTNASRIVNESLLRAEKADMEAEMLKRNINIFKRKLRSIIETQLSMVDDIDNIEL